MSSKANFGIKADISSPFYALSETPDEARNTLLNTYNWQINHIKLGLEQAKAGNFVEESEWRKHFHRNI